MVNSNYYVEPIETNRTIEESINHMFPDRCDDTLSDALRLAHMFHWNFNRYYSGEELFFNQMDYSAMLGISSIPHYSVLHNHETTTGPFWSKKNLTFAELESTFPYAKNCVKTLKYSRGSHKSSLQPKRNASIPNPTHFY